MLVKIMENKIQTKTEKHDISPAKSSDFWEEIGFHRPLGGFMYNYILGFVGLVFGVVVGGLLISLLYPYPESKGYRDLAHIVFIWALPFIDFGVAFGIERFIGEYRIKNQAKMLEFIRFFVWYNLFSSLFKTTLFSILTFTSIRNGNLAYLSWNLLLLAIQNYPGILYLLRSCMAGLQHYHKANLLNLIGSEIFDKVFLLIFIFMWRNIGNQNPTLGELLTMSFGTTFAYYMHDFFMFIVQILVIKPILKNMDIPLKSFFRTQISKDTIKIAIKSGVSVSLVSIIAQITTYLITMLYVDNITNYTTISVLSSSAMSFINFIDYFGKIDLTPSFSESYQNQKKNLSIFYIAQIWKYWGYVNGSMMFTFVAFLNILAQTILSIPGLENYSLIGYFLLPCWIYKFFLPLAEQGDTLIVGAMRLKIFQILRIFEEFVKIIWLSVIVFALKWQDNGILAIAYLLIFAVAIPQWIKTLIVWIYIKNHLLDYRIPIWQSFVAPFLSGLIVYGLISIMLQNVFPILSDSLGTLFAGIIMIVFTLLVFPTIIFPFFYGLFGGWDDFGLKVYKKSVLISGPSKIFYKNAMRCTQWAAQHSFLMNKFPIPHHEAELEIQELMQLKHKQN